eukprot:COSAG06_NODE_66496_length_254_cov_0.670968_1_plen_31_part_01
MLSTIASLVALLVYVVEGLLCAQTPRPESDL